MRQLPIPADKVQDPFEKNVPGLGFGRDPVRTPMQWEPGPAAGFTTVQRFENFNSGSLSNACPVG